MVSEIRPCLRGRYRVLRQLSVSSANRVFLAEDLRHGGRLAALKLCLAENSRVVAAAQREFEILRRLRHPGVAEVFDFGRLSSGELDLLDVVRPSQGSPRTISPASTLPLDGRRWSEALRSMGNEESSERPSVLYLASKFYEGLHLREAFLRLFPDGSPASDDASESWQIFLRALAGICQALDSVHAHNLIHYDIKPENLLLIPDVAVGPPKSFHARILDFGLSDAETTPLGGGVRGTIPFLAPELLREGRADRRSDLFSLGVTIAYAISGRFPFVGTTPKSWMAAARRGRLVGLEKLCPSAPPGLCELIQTLCKPAPDDRPANALSVLQDLERMGSFRQIQAKPSADRVVPRTTWRQEVTAIQHTIEQVKRGDAEKSLVLVEGSSKHFPRQLLDEVETLAMMEDVRVYSGTCRVPAPFAFGPFAEILSKLAIDVDLGQARFRRHLNALRSFSPGPLPSGRHTPPLPSALAARRFRDSVAEFFVELGRAMPLVLCFQDLHLAATETLELIQWIARYIHLDGQASGEDMPSLTAPSRVLLVGTYSAHESSPSGAEGIAAKARETLAQLPGETFATVLQLGDIGLDQLPEWLRELAPQLQLSGDFLRRLHEESGGVPRNLDEFVRRALTARTDGSGDGEQTSRDALPHARRPDESLLQRAQALEALDRDLLDLLAAAHGSLSLKQLTDLGAFAEPEIESLAGCLRRGRESIFGDLRRLEQEGFLELREGIEGMEACLSSVEVGEGLWQRIPHPRRLAMHRVLARLLASLASPQTSARSPEDAALQARLGERPVVFIEQMLVAADRLRKAHALSGAARVFEEVLDYLQHWVPPGVPTSKPTSSAPLPSPATAETRREVTRKLVEIYFDLGLELEAFEKLTVLASLCEPPYATEGANPLERGTIYRRLGQACQRSGHLGDAGHFFERSATLLRNASGAAEETAANTELRGELARTLLASAKYCIRTDELKHAEAALREIVELTEARSEERSLRCEAYRLQAELDRRSGSHAQDLSLNVKALALAKEEGDPLLLSETLGAVGTSYVAQGEYDEAILHFEQRVEVAKALDCKPELGVALSSLGTVYYNRSHHEKALEYYSQNLLLQQQAGELRGIANSYNNLGLVYQVRDELGKASECFKQAIDVFTRTGDAHGMAAGMNNLSSVLDMEGKYAQALEYAFRGLEKRKRLRSRTGIAFCYYQIAKIYESRGELEKAGSYAAKGLQVRQALGQKLAVAYSGLQLGGIRLGQSRYDEFSRLCQKSLADFRDLRNELGVLLAREVLARGFLQMGDSESAKVNLLEVLEGAGQLQQKRLQGSCLLQLALVAYEDEQPDKAASLLENAERIFRVNKSQRELAQTLLERARLNLWQRSFEPTHAILEQAYSLLEKLGIRDLVPAYFLLRGRLEAACAGPEPEATGLADARKFLERGLVETRELNLVDQRWRFHLELGKLESGPGGDVKLGRIHLQEGLRLLEGAHERVPETFQGHYFSLRERAEFQAVAHGNPGLPRLGKSATTPPRNEVLATSPVREPVQKSVAVDRAMAPSAVTLHALKLHEIAATMGSEPDLQKLLECVLDAVLGLVNAERGFVILRRGSRDDNTVVAARNFDRKKILHPKQKVSDSVAARVLRTGRSVRAGDALDDQELRVSRSVRDLKLRSVVCVPLEFRGDILGVIYLDNCNRRDAFSEADVGLLQTFAHQAAVAVKNAELIEENKKRTQELEDSNVQKERLNLELRQEVHRRTAQLAVVKGDLRQRQTQLQKHNRMENLVGRSQVLRETVRQLGRVARSDLAVLIHGDSGTGKELAARCLHYESRRKQGPFVSEICGALAEGLLESELFGHVRGAFTGAVTTQKGLFEQASGGTLFLDAVGDMPASMQQKLLRVLQEGVVRPVGGKKEIQVDVRVVCATSRDLERMVKEGTFREDLYYRLAGVTLRMPTLRERPEDIPLLVEHFLRLEAAANHELPRIFLPETMRALMKYPWPGNVRELRHLVEKTVLLSDKRVVSPEDLELPDATGSDDLNVADEPRDLRNARDGFEREFLRRVLERHSARVAPAARDCGVSRETFYRLLRKHGLDRPTNRSRVEESKGSDFDWEPEERAKNTRK